MGISREYNQDIWEMELLVCWKKKHRSIADVPGQRKVSLPIRISIQRISKLSNWLGTVMTTQKTSHL